MTTVKSNKIHIYARGTRVTDPDKAVMLSIAAPLSFRKAQDVLIAAKKYINKSGFFVSEKTRIQRLQSECYELVAALNADNFMTDEMKKYGNEFAVIEFFSLFSDVFPNWQKEYEALNDFVPRIF